MNKADWREIRFQDADDVTWYAATCAHVTVFMGTASMAHACPHAPLCTAGRAIWSYNGDVIICVMRSVSVCFNSSARMRVCECTWNANIGEGRKGGWEIERLRVRVYVLIITLYVQAYGRYSFC